MMLGSGLWACQCVVFRTVSCFEEGSGGRWSLSAWLKISEVTFSWLFPCVCVSDEFPAMLQPPWWKPICRESVSCFSPVSLTSSEKPLCGVGRNKKNSVPACWPASPSGVQVKLTTSVIVQSLRARGPKSAQRIGADCLMQRSHSCRTVSLYVVIVWPLLTHKIENFQTDIFDRYNLETRGRVTETS